MGTSARNEWERLTSLATLGVARPGVETPSLPHPSLTRPDAARETTFLRTAAAQLVWTLAGERMAASTPPITATPSDARYVSDAAARRLARMLADEPRELVPEWLELASSSGAVLPPAWVPPIYDALEPALRDRYAPVFGPTLARLASLDARWAPASSSTAPPDEVWSTGTVAQRLAVLREVRNVDPARARAWVESTWEADPPDVRELVLDALQIRVGADDEAFLERALDDRRKPVRLAAATALARVRESAFVRRACARVEPHFVLAAKSTGLLARFTGRKLEVTLPTALDKAAQRDGLEAKPPTSRKIGERAWWLFQMLAAVPPDVHAARFQCTPAELLAAARDTDHADEILDALVLAAARHRCVDWIAPRAEAARRRATGADGWPAVADTLVALLDALEPGDRAATLLAQLETLNGNEQTPLAYALVTRVDAAWTPALTRRALRVLEDFALSQKTAWTQPRNALEAWARRVDLGIADALVGPLLERLGPDQPWYRAVERLHDLVRFRTDLRKELLP